ALGSQLERLATRSALGGGRPASPLSLGGGRQAPYRLQQQLQQQLREQHAERQLQEAQLAQLASAGTSGMLETLHTLFGTGEVAQALAGVGDVKLEPAGPDEENSVVQTGLNPKKLFIGQIRRDFSHGPSLQALFEPFGQLVNFRFLEGQ
ncbi:unnamed protein product, partial [Prorocentrum cordatum]